MQFLINLSVVLAACAHGQRISLKQCHLKCYQYGALSSLKSYSPKKPFQCSSPTEYATNADRDLQISPSPHFAAAPN